MRFRQRTKVDLPQPDGPMIAVARFAGMSKLMSCSAWFLPNHAFRFFISMRTPMGLRGPLIHTATRDEADHADSSHDQNDQHQRTRPSLPVPFEIGRAHV